MHDPQASLNSLLKRLFEPPELRRFLIGLGGPWAEIADDLPGVEVGKAEYAFQTVKRLVGRGLADEGFFSGLCVVRSGERAEIGRIAEAFGVPVLAQQPAAPPLPINRRALDAYIRAIKGRADLVAGALCGDGPRRLSKVYVRVHLDPKLDVKHDASLHEIRTVEAALARGGTWTLLGEAGSGKSSLLHHVTLDLLAEVGADGLPKRLPVPLRAPRLQAGAPLDEAIAQQHNAAVAPSIMALLEAGRAVLLIDGLDEAADVQTAARVVNDLTAEAPDCPALLASRPEGYSEPRPEFIRLTLCGLEEPAQAELLDNLGVPAADAAAILARLRARPQLRRVAESPLLLTLVATLWRKGERQPERRSDQHQSERRSELFADAIWLIASGRHRAGEAHRRHPDPDAAVATLTTVAGALGGRGQVWDRGEVLSQLGRTPLWRDPALNRQVSPAEALDQLVQTGLLAPDDPDWPRAYHFPHRSLGEHLAARHLAARVRDEGVDGPSLGEALAAARAKPEQWTEVLAQTTGLLDEDKADGLVRRVIGMRATDLMLRLVAEAEVLRPETFAEALQVERGWMRWEARKKLLESLPGRVKDPAVVVGLIRRFVQGTTDGNDLFWARETLRAVAAGDFPTPVDRAVREDAAAAAMGIFGHLPKEKLERVKDLLARWWKTIPPEGERLGPYKVGSEERNSKKPVHDVTLAAPIQMLGVPVTWEMYRLFDPGHDAAPDTFSGRLPPDQQSQVPVYDVTWYAATMFAAWVGARLPLEAEWEYASRAGTTTRYWSGDTEADLARVGWYDSNSDGHPHPVAQKPANPWGLHDVHGNVWEWCHDLWTEDHAGAAAEIDSRAELVPGDPSAGRVFRGGSWYYSAAWARAACRNWYYPSGLYLNLGFRLVLPSSVPVPPAGL